MKRNITMAVQADLAMKSAVKKAIARQWQAGLPIHVIRCGKIVHLYPESIAVSKKFHPVFRT